MPGRQTSQMMSVDYFIRCVALWKLQLQLLLLLLLSAAAVALGSNVEVDLIQLYICMQLKHKSALCQTAAIQVPSAYQATRRRSWSIGQHGEATGSERQWVRGEVSRVAFHSVWWAIIICMKNDRLAYGMLWPGLTSLTMHICIWLAAN